jgi:Beta-lactamase class C and other penicillin binding proteins
VSLGWGSAVSDGNKKPGETHLEQNHLASHVEDVDKGPIDFQPGSRWMYSPGTGLDVVARIIEITSGQPFNEFVQENIFDPLDMKDTHWKVPLEKYSQGCCD